MKRADVMRMMDRAGIEDDCPLCGAAWPMCQGLCTAHEALHGRPGPFHEDYSDDCDECSREQMERAR